ncbi:MAG TPA: aminopeptidase N [Hyphomicrobiaceae bacterium]|nr:aminopeptidase N [Hyphomicrobiaceae bacterium]
MRTETPQPILLKDYQPPSYLIRETRLDFVLDETATRVTNVMTIEPNGGAKRRGGPLRLDGEDIELDGVWVDDKRLAETEFVRDETSLTILMPPQRRFRLKIATVCNPKSNTSLSGLYLSRGIFCTQCEAEGFRRITYYLDRPDVMAKFTVRIEADRDRVPVLLSNGNPRERGTLAGGARHYAIWQDPHPKPSYLFALVGGDLGSIASTFRTKSGREVDLRIYVEHGKEARCGWAMDCLKRSMRWDEERFGCEYDLDVFNIVAVSDFNMGAMENKGLNIFNDRLVLATPETATDAAFLAIERVIAHEYFHNWTGNRITCRDWFQLCLKEGLTVYRDQEFSADTHSRPVQRIQNVRMLKAAQFPEDAGPLAHPVRPDRYIEINNFYTTTIYEKGSELVRMIATLTGPKLFKKGMDLYFSRHDGEAATVEDFVRCFEDASGRDLKQFMIWYAQAGTPRIVVSLRHNAKAGTVDVTFEQVLAPTPGQPRKKPLHVPIRLGLLDGSGRPFKLERADGGELSGDLVEITKRRETVRFRGIHTRPVPSILRGFSAPVDLAVDLGDDDLAVLVANDVDPFNRWQAAQDFAMRVLVAAEGRLRQGRAPELPVAFAASIRTLVVDETLETAFRAQVLALPTESDVARVIGKDVDPDAIHAASRWLHRTLGKAMAADLVGIYDRHAVKGAYAPTKEQVGARALRNAALVLLGHAGGDGLERAREQFRRSRTLNDEIAALSVLRLAPKGMRTEAFDAFYERRRDDHLVIDHWFSLQATVPGAATLATVNRLMRDPLFALTNPNKVRALLFAHAASPVNFHRADGKGYAFIADMVRKLDAVNPQIAARLAGSFRSCGTMEAGRKAMARRALEELLEGKPLSRDVYEIVSKIAASGL